MNQSRKNIAALLAVALMVSFSSTLIILGDVADLNKDISNMLTGAEVVSANGTGTTSLELLANVGLEIKGGFEGIDFGSGYVDIGKDFAILDSDGTDTQDWLNESGMVPGPIQDYHLVNNSGSTLANVTVALTSHTSARDWLCAGEDNCPDENAESYIKMEEDGIMENNCFQLLGTEQLTYTEVANSTDKTEVIVCEALKPSGHIRVYHKIKLPTDAPTGSKNGMFTYYASPR